MIGGRFTLGAPIGRGSMGTVHEAYDERLHRRVALKQISSPDPLSLRRFQREARLTARLNHPGVPAVYDLGEDYIAMEYVEGHPLSDLIAEAAPLPSGWVAAIGLQIAAVLSAAHQVSLIHRDLKPSNVVLMPTGAVKVVDFGVATLVDESLSTLTPPGVVPGTNRYQAPERQFGLTGPRSDLYSLGCVLHELGAPSTVVSTLAAHDPADRPADATAVVTLLRPALGPLPPLPSFVAEPASVPAITEAYVTLASARAQAPRPPDQAGLDPHRVRAQVERLNAAGQAEQSVALLDAALAGGPAVNLQRDLTNALFETGDFGRAAAELRALLPDLVAQVGPDHISVLHARVRLAEALSYCGDTAAALAAYDGLLLDQVRVYGSSSRPVFATRRAVAVLHAVVGDSGTAVDLLSALVRDQEQAVGPSDPDVATTRQVAAVATAHFSRREPRSAN